jgi:hypothetical protein
MDQARAYGRGDHLREISGRSGPMLTQERLGEVSWTLDKMKIARGEVERLLDGEPEQQPPTERSIAIRKIEAELARLEIELEQLFS